MIEIKDIDGEIDAALALLARDHNEIDEVVAGSMVAERLFGKSSFPGRQRIVLEITYHCAQRVLLLFAAATTRILRKAIGHPSELQVAALCASSRWPEMWDDGFSVELTEMATPYVRCFLSEAN